MKWRKQLRKSKGKEIQWLSSKKVVKPPQDVFVNKKSVTFFLQGRVRLKKEVTSEKRHARKSKVFVTCGKTGLSCREVSKEWQFSLQGWKLCALSHQVLTSKNGKENIYACGESLLPILILRLTSHTKTEVTHQVIIVRVTMSCFCQRTYRGEITFQQN
jgi:hypothetical protein